MEIHGNKILEINAERNYLMGNAESEMLVAPLFLNVLMNDGFHDDFKLVRKIKKIALKLGSVAPRCRQRY